MEISCIRAGIKCLCRKKSYNKKNFFRQLAVVWKLHINYSTVAYGIAVSNRARFSCEDDSRSGRPSTFFTEQYPI